MSCGRVPAGFHDPAPRWIPLPGDPPELRRWLRTQAAEDGDDPLNMPEEPT